MADLTSAVLRSFAEHWPSILTILSGGGLWAAYALWRDRIRTSVEMLNEPFDIDGVKYIKVAPTFEIENLGARPTSLAREVKFKGYSPVERKPIRETLTIDRREQRTLQPCVPTEVTAANNKVAATYVFTWYRTYTFRPTRGFRARVRIRSASGVPLGLFRFYLELARFRLTNWVYDEVKQKARARN
jgi:hypothetical protein